MKKEISKLREELNNAIKEGRPYEEIYKLSTDLDEVIAMHYREQLVENIRQRANLYN